MRFAILTATFLASTVSGQITNGNFESGTLAGWTVTLGQHNTAIGCGSINFSGTGTAPVPGVSLYTSATTLPLVDMSLLPDPYEGSYMALLNDPIGQYHACQLSRTFTITTPDLAAGGRLGLEWGAVLEDPGHTGGCQPFFRLEVTTSCGVNQQLFVDATSAANQGWLDVKLPTTTNSFYYKHDVWCVDLSSCTPGTSVTVRITAADCALGGHGGFAFLDHVRFIHCTPAPVGMVGWWHDDTGEDLALSNDYIKHGLWFSSTSPGKVGPGGDMIFSGSNYAEVPCHTPSFHFVPDQGFACDMWVRPGSPVPYYAPLINKYWVHAGIFWAAVYDFHLEDRYLALTLKAGSSGGVFSNYVCTDARVPVDEWTHIAVSVDRDPAASEVRFYINGERRDVFSTTAGVNQNGTLDPQIMYIGRSTLNYAALPSPNQTDSFFRGKMDEIEFFNRALSDAEIEAIFESGCRGKCKPASWFTNWQVARPQLPALPPGTILTGVLASKCCKLVSVTGPSGGPSTTSTWDGRAWTHNSVPGPAGITGDMTFDTGRNVGVLIGGDPQTRTTEVWEWTPGSGGGSWIQVPAPGGPAQLAGHRVAFDSLRQRTFLFGGRDAAGTSTNDTWSWDGNSWTRVQPAQPPQARSGHAMVFDAARGVIVLFGGRGASGRALADTWTFDGQSWTAARPITLPPPRYGHAMADDPARECIALYGGTDSASDLGDTWEWNGADWQLQKVTNEPPARQDALMAFDASREKVVMMGGSKGADAMWYYGSTLPATARPFGSGCPGLRGTLAPSLRTIGHAWLGSQHEIAASDLPTPGQAVFLLGFSNTNSALGPLPISLAPFGFHSTCALLVDPVISVTLPVANQSASLPIKLPSVPSLLAAVYYSQVMALNPLTTDVALSNGVEVSIGRR